MSTQNGITITKSVPAAQLPVSTGVVTAFTVKAGVENVYATTGTAALNITLPTPSADGDKLNIIMIVDGGGDAVIQTTNLLPAATITLADVGDTATLHAYNGNWYIESSNL